MDIYEAINPIGIKQLLAEIHSGEMVLPDFQRDFVWDPAATQSLLVSISEVFPAGSLLRVRDRDRGLAVRMFSGAPVANVNGYTYLLLDGQQRLTSLYHALYGEGLYRFFVDLERALAEGSPEGDDNDTIFYRRSNVKVRSLELDAAQQARELVLPLSVFHKRPGGFWKWVTDVRNHLSDEHKDTFESNMQELYSSWLVNFDNYTFPTVTLKAEVPLEALCTIFETLNNTGVKLSAFELLVARFFKFHVNLRKLWEKAQKKHPILTEYEVEPYSAMQALSLVVSGSCVRKDVLAITREQLEDYWDDVIEGLVYGLEILRDDCKVVSRKLLPTPSMVGPLAAICTISQSGKPKGAVVGVRRARIVRWLWCAMFGQRYEAAANTRAERDVADMRAWFAGGAVPLIVEQFRFEKDDLRDIYNKSSSIYKSVISLVMASQPLARDFHSANVISQAMVNTGEVDDHHIFPSSYLENEKGINKKADRDCVLNRTLIDRPTNILISDRAPSEYLADIDKGGKTDEILLTHLCPTGEDSPLRNDDYDGFLAARAELVYAAIISVTAG